MPCRHRTRTYSARRKAVSVFRAEAGRIVAAWRARVPKPRMGRETDGKARLLLCRRYQDSYKPFCKSGFCCRNFNRVVASQRLAILDGSRYCDRSRENGRRFGVKRHIGYGWGARASRRLRLGTGQGERFGCGVRRGECPTALSDSCVLSPSCAYSANTLPLSGSASMAVARPLRGRRGRDEVSWNRCEVEVHDVQKWRAPRREAGPPRHAAGRRIPAGSVLGPKVRCILFGT